MKNKRIINTLMIMLCLLMISFFIPGIAVQTSFAEDELGGDAYAVFDSGDGSLKLFRAEAGLYTDGQKIGTKTYYTGIESVTGSRTAKWDFYRSQIKSFSVEEGDVIRPMSCSHWFYECTGLKNIDMTGLDTSACDSMTFMFYNCSSLTTLDLSGLVISNTADMNCMFSNCSSLIFLKIGPGFRAEGNSDIPVPIQRIRSSDEAIVSEPVCYEYSEITGNAPGTYRVGGKTMAVFDSGDGSLTFMNDDESEHIKKTEVIGNKTYYTSLLNTSVELPPWYSKRRSVKSVSFREAMAPVSLYKWFSGCSEMNVCDLQLLDTSKAKRADDLFSGCTRLYKIALGESSVFSVDTPYNGWKRYRLCDGSEVSGPGFQSLYEYDGTSPGWYGLDGYDICAVYDSADGSLEFFSDDSNDYSDGHSTGTKTYYTGFSPFGLTPWSSKSEYINSVVFRDRIEPPDISYWFSYCTGLSELDMTNLKIPDSQTDAFIGCISLERIAVGESENDGTIDGISMLSGIWRNLQTGDEKRLVSYGGYTDSQITGGEWEIVRNSEVRLNIDSSALNDPEIYEGKTLDVYRSRDGETSEGQPIGTVGINETHAVINDPSAMYISELGNIEYYEYCFSGSDGITAFWDLEPKQVESVLDYSISLRDSKRTAITGEIRWEGDKPEERPESIIVELWQNGSKIAEKSVSSSNGWEYSFTVPITDSKGALYRYEVKEANVDNYRTEYEEHDGMRLTLGNMGDIAGPLFFRHAGRWYMADIDFNGGVLTFPGDAFFMPVGSRSNLKIANARMIQFSEEGKRITEEWKSYQLGEEISMDEWLTSCSYIEGVETGVLTPLTDNDGEIMEIIGDVWGVDTEQYLLSVSEPYPIDYSDNSEKIIYGTFETTSITNISMNGTADITGRKIWDDNDHPGEVTVILEQNGNELRRQIVTESDGWFYSFKDVPMFDNEGNEFEYSVTEKPIKGYRMTKEEVSSDISGKSVRVSFLIDRTSTDTKLNRGFLVAYDRQGNAYKYVSESSAESGEYTVVFPTMDFDLVFTGDAGSIKKGLKRIAPDFPVRITSVEIIDSPYEYTPGMMFFNPDDEGDRWTLYDLSEEELPYPDRSRLYHYGEDEEAALAFVYPDELNVIPYSILNCEPLHNLINEYVEGQIRITKKNENGDPLKGAEFALYFTENTVNDSVWTKSEQAPTSTGITNENGELLLTNVPFGCYLLEEITAPPGYKTDDSSRKIVINGGDNTIIVSNEETRTLIKKENEKGELLEGAHMKLFTSDGTELYSWTSDGSEAYEIRGLTEGEVYVLKEIDPPEGYRKAEDISFEVEKGKDTEVVMTDRPEYVPLPIPTGVKESSVLILLSVLGAALLLLKRKIHKT